MELCDIYIIDVKLMDMSWIDNPDPLIDEIYNHLNEVNNLHFSSVSVNMAQVYNVHVRNSRYESMNVYLKGVKYNQKQFIDLENTKKMIKGIKEQLLFINNLTYKSIECRDMKSYSNDELGVYTQEKIKINKPIIIESSKN